MSFKLFIIPWIVYIQHIFAAPISQTTSMMYMNPNVFYDFLQRQHHYNNALLMNNGLLANTMTATGHATQLQPGLIFPPSFGTINNQLPNQFAQSNQQLTLLSPHISMTNGLVPSYGEPLENQKPHTESDTSTVLYTTSQTTLGYTDAPRPTYSTPQIKIKDDSELSTTTTPSEENEQHQAANESSITPNRQSSTVIDKTSDSNIYGLLKNINLTEHEKINFVQYVHEIVKEELSKKLSDQTISTQQEHLSQKEPLNLLSNRDEGNIRKEREENSSSMDVSYKNETSNKENLSEQPEIKLHPPKKIFDKDSIVLPTPIKTSDKHILVQEKMNDDELIDKADKKSDQVETTIVPSVDNQVYLLTHNEDTDLLELETGAPLDLSEAEIVTLANPAYRSRFQDKKTIEYTTYATTLPMVQTQSLSRRVISHPETTFDKLAKDYRERLTGTGDINKILKSFYDNAYIQLVPTESRAQRQRKIQRKAIYKSPPIHH